MNQKARVTMLLSILRFVYNCALDRKSAINILGVWVTEDSSWYMNTKQICIKAYSSVPMLSILKYAGICRDDLILIYKVFIRSVMQYCSVTFHTGLTIEQSKKLDGIQNMFENHFR